MLAQKQYQKRQFNNKYIMLLNEFFYFNEKNNDFAQDRRYESSRDRSVISKKDTRKIRLTLRQINQLRLQSEAHQLESQSELDFIRQMYGTPVGEEAAPAQYSRFCYRQRHQPTMLRTAFSNDQRCDLRV